MSKHQQVRLLGDALPQQRRGRLEVLTPASRNGQMRAAGARPASGDLLGFTESVVEIRKSVSGGGRSVQAIGTDRTKLL
ncbi:hypothetical protein ACIBI7_49905 [Nonomuraea fuscirosea]|uniref:hypothetical protein n=1 Tax=Nonomuraea fuscirosea TaxID=1291556 RepID=UPI0037B90763